MMKAQVMKGASMMPPPEELVSSEMDGLVNAIASYRNTANAIGYSVYYYVDNMYMQQGIKLLQIDGVAPTNAAIASGQYPYRQPFYAVIRADAPGDSPARRLYDWLATDEGRALVDAAGYVAAPAADGK
jgi:phosphate transport system substrate-binding protein